MAKLPDKLKDEPQAVRDAWAKAYDMALRRFKNDAAVAAKAADKAASRVRQKLSKMGEKPRELEIRVEKIQQDSADPNYFFGWGYVCEKGGERITDVSGQTVPLEELEKSFYKMMLDYRAGRELHKNEDAVANAATVIEGVIFTPEKCDAMGMTKNADGHHEVPYGAWLGFTVHEAGVKEKILSGEYAALSIGGFAQEKVLQEKSADPADYVALAKASIAGASSYADLDRNARGYLDVLKAMVAFQKPAGGGKDRHGPSIKCPDIYEALREEGKDKETAARISNECAGDSSCNCH